MTQPDTVPLFSCYLSQNVITDDFQQISVHIEKIFINSLQQLFEIIRPENR